MLKQSNLIKADKRTLNSYDLLYNQVSRKPFFNHSDWIASANNGSLDTYIDALFKSDKINYDDFREKYNTDYADSATRILALYTETGADRTNTDTKRKETITNPDGTTTEKEYMASDYEYNLSLIRRQNDRNQMLRQREIAQDIKDSMTVGDHIAGGFAGSVTSLTGGALNGIDNLIALLAATGEAVLDEADPTKKLDRFTDTLASDKYRLFSGFTDALVNFETNFTGIRDIDGNYSNYGKYIGGALNSLGEMLPSMLIGYGAGTAAGALGASAKVASTVSTVASQGSFYAGMASANVQDMYLQFEAAGADVSSAAILSNAAVKSTLQWGVEKLLGKMLGGTSLDNMVFGVATKGSTAKSLTAAGIKTLFKDALQEGLEEVFQDTSDFLVDRAYSVYINEFKDVTDISLQSLFDAFVIGGLMSFAGSARNVLSTRNVYVGDNKLNKLASWQYGLNLQSFAESLNVIEKSMYHIGADGELEMNRYLDKKDMDTVRAAVLESYAAYRMVTSVYESIGEERFKAANEILDKITDKIKSGFFYIETADEYIKTVRKTLGEFAAENIKKTIEQAIGESADELKESGVSEIKKVIDKNIKSTDKTSTKAKEVAEAMKADNVVVTDGDTLIEKNGTLFIDENKLNKSTGELLKAKAFQVLVDKVNTAFAKGDVIRQLVEIYKVYTGRSDPDSKEMITALFYDKDFFSSTLLDGNKDVYKFLSYFVELGNNLKEADSFEKIQKYAITRIISNWTESLTEYCIIHPQADPNLFLYAVKDADKRKALSDRIKRERWGGEVYRTVIENPDLLSDVDKKVLRNRVNRVFADKKTQDTLWNNLMSANESTRQIAMNTLSAKYDNLFNAGYDGLTYLTDTSIPNRRFNKFLKSKNLTVKTMLNEAHLSEADKSLIMSEFGEITDLTILKLRKMQFEQMQPNCTFEYSKTGAVNVYMNGAMVGYGKLHAGIRDVVSIENEKDLRKRAFTYDAKQRSNLLYGLLTETLNDLTRKYITVDDIINNGDLLSDASKQSVIAFMKNRYGITTDTVNEEYVYLWLSDYLIKSTQTQSIITMDDGTFAIGDVTNMSAVFNEKFQLNENSALEDIFKSKYIPNGLKIKFTDDAGTAHFIGYNTKTQDGKSFTVIDNTIYIPKSFLKYDNDYKKFVLAHELQHAIQFDKHMNHGFADNWADFVSDKLFNSIVKDVRMHMPHLFVNVKNGSKVERDIVSSFVYYGSGESDAYGLNRSKLLDFYPVVISNAAAGTQVTLPWGTTFKITDSDVKVTVNDLIATVNKITNNANFVSYFNDKRNSVSRSLRDMNVLRDMNAKKSSYNSTRTAIENNKIVDSYIGGSTYDRNNLQNVKEALLRVLQANDGTLKNKTLETMYVDLKYSTTYEAFLESEIPFVSVSHPSIDNTFAIGIVGNTAEDVDNQVAAFVANLGLGLKDVTLSYGSIKAQNVYGYLSVDNIKQVLVPTSEINSIEQVQGRQGGSIPQAIVDMYEEQSRIDQDAFVREAITDKIPAPKANELAEDDPRAEHFLKSEERGHHDYLVRYLVMDKNGNQVFRSGKEHDYPLYNYYQADEKTKTRKVGQRKWKGTKLEPFTKKYEVKQLSKEFQDFILNAEGLDPALQDKIDGKLKGTLTENEVMSYLRSKDSIDDVTFRAINKAFFKNQYIDSFKELTDIIRDAPEAWVLWRAVKNTAGLRNMFKSLDDREISISTIRDIVLNDKIDLTEEGVEKSTKKPSERYKDYVYQYTNISNETGDRSLEVPEHYMRLSLMKHYDGSIKTMRDAASAARVASLSLKWEVTPKDDRWNQEFHDAYADAVESFDDMTDEDIITALLTRKAAELRERYSDDYYKYKAEALAYRLSLMKLSRKELVELLGGHDGLNNALVESVVVDATGQYVKINEEAKPKARTYVDRMKGAARTIKKRLTGEEQAKLVKKYPDLFNDDLTPKKGLYQNMVKNKSRRGGEHVVYKDLNEVISAFEQINEIKNEVLLNHRSIKRELELERKVHNETKRQLKKLEQGVKADGKTPHVIEIVTDEGVEQLAVEKEMPLQMLKMLQVHYNNTAKTKVQNLSGENDRHKKRVANNFYENADEILLHLTQADVDSIIDFMVNGIVNLNDATAPYQVAEMLIMTYFIEIGRTGTVKLRSKSKSGLTATPVNFVISEKQLNALEDLLEKRISRPATVLATWRNVLHQLDPVQTIMQSVARRSGVKPTEDEVQELLDAVSSGEKAKIEATRKKVYEAMTKRLNESRVGVNNFDKFLDKLLQWERLAMLSSPGTWVRNATSNCIVRGINWTADKLIPGMDNILYKLFPKSAEIDGQYKMAGTSIDKTVAEYIKIKLKDSGLLDLSIEGSSKYDTRKSLDGVDNVTVLTEMITRATTNVANTSSLFVKKPLANMERLIKKAISDDPWVKKATLVYLGKMITEDIASSKKAKADNVAIDAYNDEIKRKNKGVPKKEWRDQLKKYKTVKIDSVSDFMSEGEISKEFLVYVAEAYKLAAYDYMHRNNALLAFESKLAAKNFRAYAAYKQIFPFAGVGWNWFVEGLNYTPIGLAKAIINFAKLENTIEKFEDARMKFKYGEVGVSSDFASYITKRNITKGLIGSIGFIAGALLVAFGVAGIDEEDDKYKLIIGDVAIDISDIFSTQGILLGIAITSSVKNGDALSDVCIAALDQAFMDSTFSDVFNTFRYADSFGEAIAYQFYAIPNMAIPNILKLISDYAEPHDIKFSAGIHGKIQKLAVNALPTLAHLMPHYYDPYTGEKQVTEKYWALTKLVDKLTPLGLSVYNVSDLEKMAIKYGVNRTALTGRYTINDKDVKLGGFDIEKLNMYYGQLNVADFKEMESGRNVYKIQQPNGTYKKVRWSQMSEKEKVAVVNRIMNNNSNLAKIYILTDSNNYKYYATESEYKELRALGITKNVYKASGNKKGFIEN